MDDPKDAPREKNRGLLIIIGIIGGGLALLFVLVVTLTDGSISEEHKKAQVWAHAQDECRKRLKAPSTASFGSGASDTQIPADVVTSADNGNYQVMAWVDSQNSSGETIRTMFMCNLKDTSNGFVCTTFWFLK